MKKPIILVCSMIVGFSGHAWAYVPVAKRMPTVKNPATSHVKVPDAGPKVKNPRLNRELHEAAGTHRTGERHLKPILEHTPILWQLVNPLDGSKHLIMGTAHRMNVSLRDFPPEVQAAIVSADTLIGELSPSDKGSSDRSASKVVSTSKFTNPVLSYYRKTAEDDDLPTQLGEKHWRTLQGMFKDRKANLHKDVLHIGLKYQDAQTAISVIRALALQEAYADNSNPTYPTLDAQIADSGLTAGKKLVGLETLAELEQHVKQYRTTATEHLQNLDHKGDMLVEILKNIIDKGGINYLRDKFLQARTAYLDGNVLKALGLLHPFVLDPYFDEIILDQRNLAWIEGGKIQDLCWAGNRCFIFIGFAHLFKDKHPLIKLLRQQGFEVTATEPAEPELEQDGHVHTELLGTAD